MAVAPARWLLRSRVHHCIDRSVSGHLACRLLSDIGGDDPKAPVLKVDNKGAISLCQNPMFHNRSKHIDTQYHNIRECIEGGKISIEFASSEEQLADVLTKLLGYVKFLELCPKIAVVEIDFPSYIWPLSAPPPLVPLTCEAKNTSVGVTEMRRKPVLICCGVLVAVVVVLAAVFVALYFTVFRPRAPHVVATVVGTETLAFNVVPPVLNLTMHVEVTVDNPNYASFRYGDVVTVVRYHGAAVGQSVVLVGEIGARATQTITATVEVDTLKVIFTPYFPLEGIVGVLPFETATAVAGKAVVLGTFKVSARSEVVCEVTVYPLRNNATTQCTSTVHIGR
ncbi:uncharacterized protein LOC133892108 [Phragmites australis]|uniref:uncharacterized protein LOC133892108 n=1 Tax=Phragmites australis TaxID=29695 RepID=UPI002D79BD92|nr:uncharacterized protein LOC133892108 [Phragmites australis]